MTPEQEKEFLDSYPQTAPPGAGHGHPGHLTAEEIKAVEHLRELLKAEGYTLRLDDATLCRFLRARSFDVHKAHDMYAHTEKWRKENNIDDILYDFAYEETEKVKQYYPQYYYKTDKDGRPVYYEEIGKVDIHALYKITTMDRMLKNLIWEYESFTQHRLPACSREVGYLVETSCTVLDLRDVSLYKASSVYSYIREASYIGQNYYPERMGKFYVINAPWGFSGIWSVIKRFLDPVTVDKIHIVGYKYQSELLKQIPPQNLPEEYGGKSPGGVNKWSDLGPWRDPKNVGPEGMAPRNGTSKSRTTSEKISNLPDNEATATAPATVPETTKEASAEEFQTPPAA